MTLSGDDLARMERLPRVQLANSLPGAKPLSLVGTRSAAGLANLAPFSSIIHLGSNPVFLGMVTRPDTVERHTLRNIIETQQWTLNHVTRDILPKAHQCSARYSGETSEFEATGLTEHKHPDFHPPFVKESPLRIGLNLEQIIDITANHTKLIIGKVELIDIPGHSLPPDGSLDLAQIGTVASTALDTYFGLTQIARLPYAKAPII